MASIGVIQESECIEPDQNATADLGKQPTVFKRAHTVMLTNEEMQWFDDYFVKLEPLGEPGTFGMAFRCYKRNDPNKTSYAVKQINKAKFYFNDTKEVLQNMKNEIDIMNVLVNHDHIIKLYETYEDRNWIYYILDCLSGGELFGRIEEMGTLSETYASTITKQIFSALEFMQQHNVAHLDLKPDNILFVNSKPDAPIKIIDFGEAKFVKKHEKFKVKIGTPFYMAPEVIHGEYEAFPVDLWSTGVVVYCMLFGYVPFYEGGDDEDAIFKLIEDGFVAEIRDGWGPWFPKDIPISTQAMSLISGLLTYDATNRLNVDQCLAHDWVNGSITASLIRNDTDAPKLNALQSRWSVIESEDEDWVLLSPKDGIVKKGYLRKEGKLFKSWKRRYFKLWNDGVLSYYASEEDKEPIFEFSIDKDSKIVKSKKIKHGIIICTLQRNWKLICYSQKQRDQWIVALEKVATSKVNKLNIVIATERGVCVDWKDTVLVCGYLREMSKQYQMNLGKTIVNIINLLHYGYNTHNKGLHKHVTSGFGEFTKYIWNGVPGSATSKMAIEAVKKYKFGDLTKGVLRRLSKK